MDSYLKIIILPSLPDLILKDGLILQELQRLRQKDTNSCGLYTVLFFVEETFNSLASYLETQESKFSGKLQKIRAFLHRDYNNEMNELLAICSFFACELIKNQYDLIDTGAFIISKKEKEHTWKFQGIK